MTAAAMNHVLLGTILLGMTKQTPKSSRLENSKSFSKSRPPLFPGFAYLETLQTIARLVLLRFANKSVVTKMQYSFCIHNYIFFWYNSVKNLQLLDETGIF